MSSSWAGHAHVRDAFDTRFRFPADLPVLARRQDRLGDAATILPGGVESPGLDGGVAGEPRFGLPGTALAAGQQFQYVSYTGVSAPTAPAPVGRCRESATTQLKYLKLLATPPSRPEPPIDRR